jgi:hypothetical protein
MIELAQLGRIIDIEYHDILARPGANIHHEKIRAYLLDSSFVDIWFSRKIPGRFSYHWERRHIDGTIYRHDNFPDPRWKAISTFPKHFHDGSQTQVRESLIDDDPLVGLHQFMDFVLKRILALPGRP